MPTHLVYNVLRAVCSTRSPIWSRCDIEAGAGGSPWINYVCDYRHLDNVKRTGASIPKFADQSIMSELEAAVSQLLGTLTKAVATCWQ